MLVGRCTFWRIVEIVGGAEFAQHQSVTGGLGVGVCVREDVVVQLRAAQVVEGAEVKEPGTQ